MHRQLENPQRQFLRQYKINPAEEQQLKNTRADLITHSHSFQRKAFHLNNNIDNEDDWIINDYRYFLNNKSKATSEPSKIHYMEVINMDLKGALTLAYLQKTSLFFNYRIKLLKHFKAQLYPEEKVINSEPSIKTRDPAYIKMYKNIVNMVRNIVDAKLLPTQTLSNRGLINTFTNSKATQEQAHDMLAFRNIGEEALDNYITHDTRWVCRYAAVNAVCLTFDSLLLTVEKVAESQDAKKSIEAQGLLYHFLILCVFNYLSPDPNMHRAAFRPIAILYSRSFFSFRTHINKITINRISYYSLLEEII